MTVNNRYELPRLGYEYDALEPTYSAELLELHYSKHHQGYVNGANSTREELAEARQKRDFEKIGQLQKNLAFNLSGHILHSLFWRNISPGDGKAPSSQLQQRIDEAFGNIDALREQFRAAGSSIQGSGWAALAWEPVSRSLVIEQVHDHQGNIGNGTVPLMVMDMWEHAFYLQYRNEKKRWIEAYWELINWSDVGHRLESVKGLDLCLEA